MLATAPGACVSPTRYSSTSTVRPAESSSACICVGADGMADGATGAGAGRGPLNDTGPCGACAEAGAISPYPPAPNIPNPISQMWKVLSLMGVIIVKMRASPQSRGLARARGNVRPIMGRGPR